MKAAILSILFLSLISVSRAQMSNSQAQTNKITIYCDVSGLRMDYYGLEKFLPDSIKTTVLIDYYKQYRPSYADLPKILLLMGADGWTICARVFLGDKTVPEYTLSKEILLDGPALQIYLGKIKSSLKKGK